MVKLKIKLLFIFAIYTINSTKTSENNSMIAQLSNKSGKSQYYDQYLCKKIINEEWLSMKRSI